MKKAILYDLDGVLVDAVYIHHSAFIKAVKTVTNFTITNEYHEENLNGLPTSEKLNQLVKSGVLQLEYEDKLLINNLKQQFTIEAINKYLYTDPQKRQLHFWAKEQGYNIACVTNCSRNTAELMLEKTGQLELLDLIITNNDVKKYKPDPEPYLKAMSIFRLLPEECLVVEDTQKGLQAGTAAGCKVFFVNGPDEVNIANLEQAMQ